MRTITELWNNHKIRFIDVNGEWWAVAKDISQALGYRIASDMTRMVSDKQKGMHNVRTPGGAQEMIIISELGIYQAIFNSRSEYAEDFQNFIFNVIKELRQSLGLEAFQIFRMLDKEHQKQAMENLRNGLKKSVRLDYIKANTVTNKVISNIFGYPKMVKKADMTSEMLIKREAVLDDTVELMKVKEKYRLDISIKDEVSKIHK